MPRILLDQNFPLPVGRALGHDCADTYALGWSELTNGDLLAVAEAAGFEVMLSADRNLVYQQNLSGRRLALVIVSLNNQSALLQHVHLVRAAVDRAHPGSYEEVEIPRPLLKRRSWPPG